VFRAQEPQAEDVNHLYERSDQLDYNNGFRSSGKYALRSRK